MAEKDYSHRDVVDKLSIKPGQLVVFVAQGKTFDTALRERILARTGLVQLEDNNEHIDIVLVQIDVTDNAVEVLQDWKQRLKPNGAIWLLTPKRNQPGYVDQRDLITAGLSAGLVDNKVCSISDTTSAMRFVFRKTDRRPAVSASL